MSSLMMLPLVWTRAFRMFLSSLGGRLYFAWIRASISFLWRISDSWLSSVKKIELMEPMRKE